LPLCTDGVDNDDDQLIDLADPDCSTFIPKLTVTKIVDGGLKVVADFALFVDLGSITSGVQASSTVGVHIVSETAVANYTGVISGDCASNGSVTLAAGDAKSCTITNTFVQPSQCSDGVDNTDPEDTLADASDPGCWTDPNDSSTYSASDNDETDPSDVCPNDSGIQTSTDQCTPPPTPPAPPTTPPATSPTIGTGRSGDFRNPPGQVLGASTVGQVLGESCGLYMDKFIRSGRKNDVAQVKSLQTFLNKWMNSGLPITGYYGPLTLGALNAFQTKYANEVLTPWGLTRPTGIAYLTTLRQINMLECPELMLQIPTLIEWSKNPNAPK